MRVPTLLVALAMASAPLLADPGAPGLPAIGKTAAKSERPAASPRPATLDEIRRLVDEHLLARYAQEHHDDCPRDTGACVDAACTRLGTWGCDEDDEVLAVLRACRGNYDGACVDAACTRLGRWGCDEAGEVLPLAEACRNVGGGCVAEVCNRLGTWGCDERAEVDNVLSACANQRDGGCVKAVCDRLGTWGCDEAGEVLTVARECGGT